MAKLQGHRRGRMGIVTINSNPRPPNESPFPNANPSDINNVIRGRVLGNQNNAAHANDGPKNTGTNQNGSSNQNKSGLITGTPSAPYTYEQFEHTGDTRDMDGTSSSSTSSTDPVTPAGLPVEHDPRDERYWQDIINIQARRDAENATYDTENTFADTSYQEALNRLIQQRPKDIQDFREQANAAGGLYSSRTREGVNTIIGEYANTEGSLARDKQRDYDLRKIAHEALQSGLTTEETIAMIEAKDRATQAAIQNTPVDYGAGIADAIRELITPSNPTDNQTSTEPTPTTNTPGEGARPESPGPKYRWNGDEWVKKPGDNYKWDAAKKRWVKKPTNDNED